MKFFDALFVLSAAAWFYFLGFIAVNEWGVWATLVLLGVVIVVVLLVVVAGLLHEINGNLIDLYNQKYDEDEDDEE